MPALIANLELVAAAHGAKNVSPAVVVLDKTAVREPCSKARALPGDRNLRNGEGRRLVVIPSALRNPNMPSFSTLELNVCVSFTCNELVLYRLVVSNCVRIFGVSSLCDIR